MNEPKIMSLMSHESLFQISNFLHLNAPTTYYFYSCDCDAFLLVGHIGLICVARSFNFFLFHVIFSNLQELKDAHWIRLNITNFVSSYLSPRFFYILLFLSRL